MSAIACSLRSIDFGEILLNSLGVQEKKFTISNPLDTVIKMKLSLSYSIETFPCDLTLLIESVDENGSLFIEAVDTQSNAYQLSVGGILQFILRIVPHQFKDLEELGDYANLTTFRKLDCSMTLQAESVDTITTEIPNDNVVEKSLLNIPITASFCCSIMSLDDDKIDFDQCLVDNTYVRDFQVWNRSECLLSCELQFNAKSLQGSSVTLPIAFQDFDTGSSISLGQVFHIAAFGSKRIRTLFRAAVVCDEEYVVDLFNVNNTANCLSLLLRTAVPEQGGVHSLVIEPFASIDQYISDGTNIDFGNCHFGSKPSRRFYVKNEGALAQCIFLEAAVTTSTELTFTKCDEECPVENNDYIPKSLLYEKALEYCKEQETAGVLVGLVAEEDETPAVEINTMANRNMQIVSKENLLLDYGNSRLKDAYFDSSGSCFKPHLPCMISYLYNRVAVDEVSELVDIEYDSERSYFCSASTETSELTHVESDSALAVKNVGETENSVLPPVLAKSSSVSMVTVTSEKFILQPSERALVQISWIPTNDQRKHRKAAKICNDVLIEVQTKVNFRYASVSPGCSSVEFDSDPWNTFTVFCEAKCCEAVFSTAVSEIDLGECSIGDGYSASLLVKNECALPLTLFPVVSSQSLFVIEKELYVNPGETRLLNMEYVAQVVNMNYRRNVYLYNPVDPMRSLCVMVKAKNVDTHHVALHSLFYKIYTGNSKRNVQINMDNCVYNLSNFKVFSIRNLFNEPLVLQFSSSKNSVMSKDLRLFQVKYEGDFLKSTVDEELLLRYFGSLLNIRDKAEGNRESAFEKRVLFDNLKWGQQSQSSRQRKSTLLSNYSSRDDFDDNRRVKAIPRNYSKLDLALPLDSPVDTITSPDGSVLSDKEMPNARSNAFRGILSEVLSTKNPRVGLPRSESIAGYRALDNADESGQVVRQSIALPSNLEDHVLPSPVMVDSGSHVLDPVLFDVLKLVNSHDFPFNMWDRLRKSVENMLANGSLQDYVSKMPPLNDENLCDSYRVRVIQKVLLDLVELIKREDYMEELILSNADTPNENTPSQGVVSIPVNRTFHFVLLIQPPFATQTLSPSVSSTTLNQGNWDESATIQANSADLLTQHPLLRSFELKLLSVGMVDVNSALDKKSSNPEDSVERNLINDSSEKLKARTIDIKGKIVRSEMAISQKNINFGKTFVGDPSVRTVVITNKSSIPLLYKINKSGSISSGFLKISNGRRGTVPPFGSRTLEFVFRPSLHGNFDESIVVENILDSTNNQTIFIKSRVLKPESFQILNCGEESTKPSFWGEASVDCKFVKGSLEYYKYYLQNLSLFPHNDNLIETSSKPPTGSSLPPHSPNLSQRVLFLGKGVFRESYSLHCCFKIRNVSAKPRAFVVDYSHKDSFELVNLYSHGVLPSPSGGSHGSPVGAVDYDHSIDEELSLSGVLADQLQNFATMFCEFEHSLVSVNSGNQQQLSEGERSALEDNLEFFQQKLKIAYRKRKDDKVAKYTRKIAEIVKVLSGDTDIPEVSVIEGELEQAEVCKENSLEIQSSISKGVSPSQSVLEFQNLNPPHSGGVDNTKQTYTVNIPNEFDCVIKIKFSVFPGPNYTQFKGLLPFKGFFRVYESRNEDMVKFFNFSCCLTDSPSVVDMVVQESALDHLVNDELEVISTRDRAVPVGDINRAVSPETFPVNDVDLVRGYLKSVTGVQNLFMAAPSPWSSISMKELCAGRWSGNKISEMCNMALKLVKVSSNENERIMQGSICITSVLQESLLLSVRLDKDQSSGKFSPLNTIFSELQYVIFSENSHGSVGFSQNALNSQDFNSELLVELPGRASIEFYVQWKLPDSLVEQIKKFVGYLSVQLVKVNGLQIPNAFPSYSLFIPMVCSWEHVSIIKIEKKVKLMDVPMGTSVEKTLVLNNISETEELEYVLLVYSNVRSSIPIGNVELSGHQEGLIPPLGSVNIPITFNAKSVGKFEEILWVGNKRDKFDEERVKISANIILSQSQMIQFPDLVVNNRDETGKGKVFDLGFIQVSAYESSIASRVADVSKKFCFPFRIVNLSKNDMSVSAITNLKKQCFIFCDPECSLEALNVVLKANSTTTVYVVIRPTVNESMTNKKDEKSSQSLAGVSNFNTLLSTTRELQGGIRFLFFKRSNRPVNDLNDEQELSKLFESSITFRGVVGCSILKITMLDPLVKFDIGLLKTAVPSEFRSFLHPFGFYVGSFLLANPSQIFPINYRLDGHVCLPLKLCDDNIVNSENSTKLEADERLMKKLVNLISEFNEKPNEILTIILHSGNGELLPGKTELIYYLVVVNTKVEGLVVTSFNINNISTGDHDVYFVAQLFDKGNVIVKSILCDSVSKSLNKVAKGIEGNKEFEMILEGRSTMVRRYECGFQMLLLNFAKLYFGDKIPSNVFLDCSCPMLEVVGAILNPKALKTVHIMDAVVWISELKSNSSSVSLSVDELGDLSVLRQKSDGDLPSGPTIDSDFEQSKLVSVLSDRTIDTLLLSSNNLNVSLGSPEVSMFKCLGFSNSNSAMHQWNFSLDQTDYELLFLYPVSNLPVLLKVNGALSSVSDDVICEPIRTQLYGELCQCGPPFAVARGENVTVDMFCNVNGILNPWLYNNKVNNNRGLKLSMFKNNIHAGRTGALKGTVAFVKCKLKVGNVKEIANNLSVETGRLLNSANQYCSDVIGFYSFKCLFAQPQIKISSKSNISIQHLRPREKKYFDVILENNCDVDIAFLLLQLPTWLCVSTLKSKPLNESVNSDAELTFDFEECNSDDDNVTPGYIIKSRSILCVHFCARILEGDMSVTSSGLDVVLQFQPVVSTYSTLNLEFPLEVRVHVDIDETKPVGVTQIGTEVSNVSKQNYCFLKNSVSVPNRQSLENAIPTKNPIPLSAANIQVKNLWQDYMRVDAHVVVHEGLKGSIELQVLAGGGFFPAQSFDMLPDEAAEFRIVCKGLPDGRISSSNLFFYDINKGEMNSIDNLGKNSEKSKLKGNQDGTIGPVLLGKLICNPNVLPMESSVGVTDSAESLGSLAENLSKLNGWIAAPLSFDIVGYISLAPTSAVSDHDNPYGLDSTISSLIFYANSVEGGQFENLGCDIEKQYFIMKEQYQNIKLTNDSSAHKLVYHISSESCRRIGMRLIMSSVNLVEPRADNVLDESDDEVIDDGCCITNSIWSDTVSAQATCPDGVVAPSESTVISLYLGSGNVTDALTINQETVFAQEDELLQGMISKQEISSSLQVLALIRLEISDRKYPLHPPCRIPIILMSRIELPFFKAKLLNRNGLYNASKLSLTENSVETEEKVEFVNDGKRKLSKGQLSKSGLSIRDFSPKLRLRGVSPCVNSSYAIDLGIASWLNCSHISAVSLHSINRSIAIPSVQYEINVGQHSMSSECLEWIVTLENSVGKTPLSYRVHSMCGNNNSMNVSDCQRLHFGDLALGYEWILLGQSGGTILAEPQSVSLYFRRNRVGYFFSYVIIENISNPDDVQVLRVSMEVVQNWSKKRFDHLEPLFRVFTSVKHQYESAMKQLAFNTSLNKEFLDKTGLKDSQVIDYRMVCEGKAYRRRSLVLLNSSDTVLDMKLSSTFKPNELSFIITGLTSKPFITLTLGPFERREIFILFSPVFNVVSAKSEAKSKSQLDNVETPVEYGEGQMSEKLRSEADWEVIKPELCSIEGEIFISCRLMKDHHEAVKVKAVCAQKSAVIGVLPFGCNLPFQNPVCSNSWIVDGLHHAPISCGYSYKTIAEHVVQEINGIFVPSQFSDITRNILNKAHCKCVLQIKNESGEIVTVEGPGYKKVAIPELSGKVSGSFQNSSSSNWASCQVFSIKNISKDLSLVAALGGFMRCFGIVQLFDFSAVSKLGEIDYDELEFKGIDIDSVLSNIEIKPNETCWFLVFPLFSGDLKDFAPIENFESVESNDVTDSIEGNLDRSRLLINPWIPVAEESLTIYNKVQPAEKYRIPFRLLAKFCDANNDRDIAMTGEKLISDDDTNERIGNVDGKQSSQIISKSLSLPGLLFSDLSRDLSSRSGNDGAALTAFTALEASVSLFIRRYVSFWHRALVLMNKKDRLLQIEAKLMNSLSSEVLKNISEKNFLLKSKFPVELNAAQSSYFKACEILDSLDIIQFKNDSISVKFKADITPTDVSLDALGDIFIGCSEIHDNFELQGNVRKHILRVFQHTSEWSELARAWVEIFFHYFILTDHLALNTIRQHVGGFRSVSSHIGQPSARLAQLLYSFVFDHNSFTKGKGLSASITGNDKGIKLHRLLTPFVTSFLYFMNFFPELGESAVSLMALNERLSEIHK